MGIRQRKGRRGSGLVYRDTINPNGSPASARACWRDLACDRARERPCGHRVRRHGPPGLCGRPRARGDRQPLAVARVGPDDEPLSPAAGDAGAESCTRDAATQRHLLAGAEPTPRSCRACLPGSVQRRSRGARDSSAGVGSLRRPEPGAGGPVSTASRPPVEQLLRDGRTTWRGGMARGGLDALAVRRPDESSAPSFSRVRCGRTGSRLPTLGRAFGSDLSRLGCVPRADDEVDRGSETGSGNPSAAASPCAA